MPARGRRWKPHILLLATMFFFLQVLPQPLWPQRSHLYWFLLCQLDVGALQALPWAPLSFPLLSLSAVSLDGIFYSHGHSYCGCQWLPRSKSPVQTDLLTPDPYIRPSPGLAPWMALNVNSLRAHHPPSPSKAPPPSLLSKQHRRPFSRPNQKSGGPASLFPPLLIPQPVTPRSYQFFFCGSSWLWSSFLAQPGHMSRHPPHCSPVPVQSFLILLCTVPMMMLLKCKPDSTLLPPRRPVVLRGCFRL